jgi:hypothetical protein
MVQVPPMIDSFALLNEVRRPWLDPDVLREKFLALSSDAHPDRVHSALPADQAQATSRYSELNAAYNTLREPKERLLHLLELEAGKPKDVQRIPPGTMDLFVEVGQICRDVDAFLASRGNVTSPLMKVQLFQQAMEWEEKLKAFQRRINTRRDELAAELQRMNEAWYGAPAVGSAERATALPLERLEQIYRFLSYISRWSEQMQERTLQLAAGSF